MGYPKLLIIAESYPYAVRYAQERNLGHPGERWVYIFADWQTRGLQGPGEFIDLTRSDILDPQMEKHMELGRCLIAAGFTEVW